MYKKERKIIKKELTTIAKSGTMIDMQVYDYFMDNLDSVKFNEREIVYLIHSLVNGYFYQKDDFEYKIADFLFTQTSIKNHLKFDMLYVESFVNNSNDIFELLLRHNVVIVKEVVEYAEEYLESIEFDIYYYVVDEINDYHSMLNTLKLNTRKQKIENIRSKKRSKINLINDQIISPLILSKTS